MNRSNPGKAASEQPARLSVRMWPAVVIVVFYLLMAFWLVFAVGTDIGIALGTVAAPLAAAAMFLVWWLLFSRVPLVDRIAGVAAFLAACASVTYGQTYGGMLPVMFTPLMYALPAVMIGLTLLLSVSGSVRWPVRRWLCAGLLVMVAGGFACSRVGGFTAYMVPVLTWRWAAEPQQDEFVGDSGEMNATANLTEQADERRQTAHDATPNAESSIFDLVVRNGRVIDPETGRDEVATVAIRNGIIQEIRAGADTAPVEARQTIDATGKVVAPGFINTHTHEASVVDTAENIRPISNMLVFDGITFWLGGNCGMSPTGVKVPVGGGKIMQVGNPDVPLTDFLNELEGIPLYNHYATLSGNITLRSRMGLRHMEPESGEQIARMKDILAEELAAGSFGVSYGVMYDMGATTKAIVELAAVSRRHGGMAAMHTRYPTFNMKHLFAGIDAIVFKRSVYEAIITCKMSGVPFIFSHITDQSQTGSALWVMETLDRAVKAGLPLAGDIIGHDFLANNFFILTGKGKIPIPVLMALGNYTIDQFYAGRDYAIDGTEYVKKFGQINLEQAEFLRKNVGRIDGVDQGIRGLPLFCRIIPPADTIRALQYPWVFIGNDAGGRSIDPVTGEPAPDIPRGLATFSRLLGHWSRDEGALTLKEALFKATIAPALWLGLDKKGRIQEGCDADIVIFDPGTIIDRAGWVDDSMGRKPDGISHVIVSGQVVVENNRLTGAKPGKLVRRTWSVPGNTAAVVSLYETRTRDSSLAQAS